MTAAAKRPEIQGLRGLAVLLVVAFHLWGTGVSGGVDVFFVVSAYLLTLSFTRKVETGKPLRLLNYWSRTFVRLLLPVGVVLLSVLAVALVFFPRSRWEALWEQLLAAATYRLNWTLANQAVDYYAGGGVTSSPVQHMWSLAVQGQIFLLFPALIAAAALIARITRLRFRVVAIAVFGLVFAASLTASIFTTHLNPAPAYFDTRLRLWEFALGALVALLVTSPLPRRVAVMLGWGGVVAVIITGFVAGPGALFPGWIALLPTLGAALILVVKDHGGAHGVHVPLRSRWLTWVGDRSYGIYLWHWPLMITYLLRTGQENVPVAVGLAIIAASMVLSLATEQVVKYITRPRSAKQRASTRKELVRLVAIVGVVALPVTAAQAWTDNRARTQATYERNEYNYPGAAVATDSYDDADLPGLEPIPMWSEIDAEWGNPGPKCSQEELPEGFEESGECYVHQPQSGVEEATAVEDDASAEGAALEADHAEPARTVVLLGDSHAKQLSEPMKEIADRNNWKLITFVYPACRYAGFTPDYTEECNTFNESARDAVLELNPDAVIAQGTRSLMDGDREEVVAHWNEGVRPFQDAGIPVVSVRDNPRWERDMYECVDLYGESSSLCSDSVEDALGGQEVVDEFHEQNPDVPLVDLTDLYCPDGRCGPVVGNVMVYRDMDHITKTFGLTTAPELEERLLGALKW
ncbi:acyltransferase family protein [Kocuria sp.]|uniref:acyltransferase family protein n=1 Tax=Kocuria sp. TaxID=1871328 RepID=UPI0026DFD634|nr:acyltransferase family protein [Kocuria sp.]MDO5617986.1 acyltransferase family protein [Kocuria sp.]